MADLTSEEIFELTKREFRRILEEDQRDRMRFPGKYEFGVRLTSEGIFPSDWHDTTGLSPWEYKDATQAEKILRERLRTNRWPDLRLPVLAMLKRFGVEIADDDPTVNEVCHVYTQAFIEAVAAVRQREYGFIDYVPEVFLDDSPRPQPSHQLPVPTAPDKPKRKVSDLIREYSEHKTQSGEWKPRSVRTQMARLEFLPEVMGDVDLALIDHDFTHEFVKKMIAKPKKRQSKKAKESGEIETIRVSTVKLAVTELSALFDYARKRRWVSENFFSGITLKDNRKQSEKKQPFTTDDLALLFGPGFVDACKDIPWRFWGPILALFTGARLGEIAQLHVDDVQEVASIWCININDSGEKEVKTGSGNRIVPIHPFILEELNFLKFVDAMRGANEVELFPTLKAQQGEKGRYLVKWFSGYKAGLGIAETKSFHSFRKNFTTALYKVGTPVDKIKLLDGHSLSGDVTFAHYIFDVNITELAEYIKKIDFGLDLSHLARSRFVVVSRVISRTNESVR